MAYGNWRGTDESALLTCFRKYHSGIAGTIGKNKEPQEITIWVSDIDGIKLAFRDLARQVAGKAANAAAFAARGDAGLSAAAAADAVSLSATVDTLSIDLDSYYNEAILDAEKLAHEIDGSALWSDPLWGRGTSENSGKRYWEILDTEVLQISNKWDFWREWYQGLLDGKPLDWELQKEIALIPDADWEKGPEWIAGKIEVIRKRRDLEAEIANLKLNLEKAKANSVLPNRLHNQPPEAVDDVAQMIVSDITLIWAQIEELEEEVAKPAPSPKVLIRIAKRLADMVIKIAKYCVSLGDIALKSIAKWAGPAVITSELAAPGTLQSVSKAILEFVKALPPG